MKKKVSVQQLKQGMYIDDLDASWFEHNFLANQFEIKDEKTLKKLVKSGLKHVYIDTHRGIDVDDAPTQPEVQDALAVQTSEIAEEFTHLDKQIPVAAELNRAREIYTEAHGLMQNLMGDVRLGKQVSVEQIEPISEKMIESAFRNKDALISLSRIKNKDQYTFMHSVSVAGLMITFSRAIGLDMDTIRQVAIGGLLHDIGKMKTPNEILNKPGKLDDDEFKIMKSHVVYSRELLEGKPGITQASLDVAAQHHERVDGTGYPLGLKGDEISTVGQMSTIVDVYDALTSIRVYKSAWEPSVALKKLLEWSTSHFDPTQVKQFIRCLGIYPVGTLVELDSGLVGIVIEQGETDLLRPKLKIIYSARKKRLIPVRELDLTKTDDFIKQAVSPQIYQIDMAAFY
jgi:putative nucleotidyltransferase with HDIG domain